MTGAEYTGTNGGLPRHSRDDAARLARRLREGPALLLDGAMGTELEARGVESGLPLWSTHALLHAPGVVEEIHAKYAAAGAEILTANTFRTQRRALEAGARKSGDPALSGLGARAGELCELAVALARRAAASGPDRALVAGSAPPLEDCYRVDLVPEANALEREHDEHARNLARAGVDLILVETMNCTREAVAAARAARATGLPFLVSFVSWEEARLLSGEALAPAIDAVLEHGAMAVLVNCLPPSAVEACIPALQRAEPTPFGVYTNLGMPDAAGGRSELCSPAELAQHARRWLASGARIVGGCCGTRPDHIRAMARVIAAARTP
ncbi:MAG: homocysteine S-methyltransferase family protein [Deltaproteobacteria bacterium]|nr:homocysteine S-methyltransferase family protein [Deltaproteobacteria bacterium]